MNIKTIASVLSLVVIFVLYFSFLSGFRSKEKSVSFAKIIPTQNEPKDFINCIFNLDYFGMRETYDSAFAIKNNLNRYKYELNFNSIHIYGSDQGGAYNEPVNDYKNALNGLMSAIDTSGLKCFYGRKKIDYFCTAQRLEYEISTNGSSTLNNGFSFQKVMTNTYTTDSGRTVLHAKTYPSEGYNNAGRLCDSIYENIQHSDLIVDFFSDADGGNWYLKPVMRIKQSDFSITDTRPVIAVVVTNFDSSKGDSIIIRVNNFRDSNSYYGNYKSKFTFIGSNDSLQISGDTSHLNKGRTKLNLKTSKVDFKIYWFGQVDVWFDKLIVDDEKGNQLFNPSPDVNQLNQVVEEVREFRSSNHPSLYTFFTDEVVYSNLACVKYVQKIMKDSSNGEARLCCATTNGLNANGMRNIGLGHKVFLDSIQPEIFTNDAHEISPLYPDNLTLIDPENLYYQAAIDTTIDVYNRDLQFRFGDKYFTQEYINNYRFHGSLVYQISLARSQRDQYAPDAKFIMQPQIHAFFTREGTTGPYGGLREPTNEEIQAQAMLSIAHGADGLCWFVYQSYIDKTVGQTNQREFGLTDPLDAGNFHRRTDNIFGQDKWNYVAEMNKKISHWKPYLDITKFDSGYSVHSEGAGHNFISDVRSYYSLAIPPFSSPTIYEDSIKYWDMGFFNPDFDNPDVSSNDKSKYFIMVNRRCIPNVNNDGDLRQLKIKFDSTQLSGFKNWKIIELDSNKVIRTFDKDSNIYVDMGVYQPGEGKLYKLAPVMQEGGTLVAVSLK